jgi:(p)ppGpp synthase/HD superfamily hydrolase
MSTETDPTLALLAALTFAADRHRDHRRKGAEGSPYVNHLIEVADILARHGGVRDPVTLQAGVLHDTLEDTLTTPQELESLFGPEVRHVVEEVTDDKRLSTEERKRLQIERAPGLSHRAHLIKIADKISNVVSVARLPPYDWPRERRRNYLEWANRVVAGCRGCNAALESRFDEVLRESRELVG